MRLLNAVSRRSQMRVTPEMRQLTQHSLCCLHVYCRMRDMGIPKKWAARIGRAYELIINIIIY